YAAAQLQYVLARLRAIAVELVIRHVVALPGGVGLVDAAVRDRVSVRGLRLLAMCSSRLVYVLLQGAGVVLVCELRRYPRGLGGARTARARVHGLRVRACPAGL